MDNLGYTGPEGVFEGYDEYGDVDAISCANGDYNAWEDEQVFQDHEGADDYCAYGDWDEDYCERGED